EVPRLPTPLPEEGLLYFFLGVDEPAYHIAHRVLYWDGSGGELIRSRRPAESRFLNDECTVFDPAAVRFVPTVSLPSFFHDPSLDDEFADRLSELEQRLEHPSGAGETGRLLGPPLALSGDPLAQAYVAVQGHPDILYDLHRKPADIERELAEGADGTDRQVTAYLRRKQRSLAWFHSKRAAHER